MDNETIIPGVGINGMTEKYDIKILICYLLDSIGKPLTMEQMNDIFQQEQVVNYFSFCDALKELIEDGHLRIANNDSGEIYSLNPLGEETARRLDRSLPRSLRDNIVTTAMNLLSKRKLESENEVIIEPYQNGLMAVSYTHLYVYKRQL